MTDFAKLLAEADAAIRDKQSQAKALDVQIGALRSCKAELEEKCADLQKQLAEWRKEYDAVVVAREFCEWVKTEMRPVI